MSTDPSPATKPAGPAPLLPSGFDAVRKLGEGGMGAVWLAHSTLLDQHFAVKRTLRSSPAERRTFLRELISWSALPEHPNVLPCRFFRTVGDEILIFTDFVAGGSLDEAAADGRAPSLPAVLDLAIQMAWGLLVIHESGQVHQDIKPMNALLTKQGVLKISDFGLSSALSNQSAQVLGGTPAYQSPEQAEALRTGGTLTPASDIWSWGACILELLLGERTWMVGPSAGEVLEQYLSGEIGGRIATVPGAVAEMLRRALRWQPQERWASLDEPVALLLDAYQQAAGREFPRINPSVTRDPALTDEEYRRSDGPGRSWRAPRGVVESALAALGKDPLLADELVLEISGSRRVRMLADLYGYEVACALWAQVPPRVEAANTLRQKAMLHEALLDPAGAFVCWMHAAELWRTLDRTQLAHCLANAAAVRGLSNDDAAALPLFAEAVSLYEILLRSVSNAELTSDLAMTLANQARRLEGPEALRACDRAIHLLEALPPEERSERVIGTLARCRAFRANASEGDVAIHLMERAVAGFRELVDRQLAEYTPDLASTLLLLASQVAARRPAVALALLEEAQVLYEEQVAQRRSGTVALGYAACLMVRTRLVARLAGDKWSGEASRLLRDAIETLERLIYQEGHLEIVSFLMQAYQMMACAVALEDGDAAGSFEWNARSARLLERSLAIRWDATQAERLATVCREAAVDLGVLGRTDEALRWYRRARAAYAACAQAGSRVALRWAECCLNEADLARKAGCDEAAYEALAEARGLVGRAREELEEVARNNIGRTSEELYRLEDVLRRLAARSFVDESAVTALRERRQDVEREASGQVPSDDVEELERRWRETSPPDLAIHLLRCYHARLQGGLGAAQVLEIERKALDIADSLILSGRDDLFARAEPILDEIRRIVELA